MALVKNPDNIRLAMLGMVDGNGHPYSWSAIINGGYDDAAMSRCPYPVIYQYLSAQPKSALGIPGAKVTHIWCDDPADARSVAASSLIPNVVSDPLEVIGKVDVAVIPTDKPEEHLDRAKPFIEAGIPVFIDKPMTDQPDHLRQFVRWQRSGKPILSTSCMRYAGEFKQIRDRLGEVGEMRLITMTMCKSWERYGIHALEGIYPFLAPGGWVSVSHRGDKQSSLFHLRHNSGVEVSIAQISDLYGAFGCMGVYGTKGHLTADFKDSFNAFKTQLVAMVDWLRSGKPPVPFEQTVELMKLVIAGVRSREEGGRVVPLSEIRVEGD